MCFLECTLGESILTVSPTPSAIIQEKVPFCNNTYYLQWEKQQHAVPYIPYAIAFKNQCF